MMALGACRIRAEEPANVTVSDAATLGPCVPVPQRAYVVEVVGREANPPPARVEPAPVRHGFSTQALGDLDGDGTVDTIVPTVGPASCPHEVTWTVYLTRGACGVDVGTVLGFPQVIRSGPGLATRSTTIQWAEITDRTRPMGAQNVATLHELTTAWSAPDGVYVAGEPANSGGICHHCAISRCRLVSGP